MTTITKHAPATAPSGDKQPPRSVFADFRNKSYPFVYKGTLHVGALAGGVPANPKAIEGWIKSKLYPDNEAMVQQHVIKTIQERKGEKTTAQEVVDEMVDDRVNGFKRGPSGLYFEGRCLKSCIKEAVSVCIGAGKLKAKGWGHTKKGILSFAAEHIFVLEEELPLGKKEADYTRQTPVNTWRGTSFKYEEMVENVDLNFTVVSDYDFESEDKDFWKLVWTTAELQGLGASRTQSIGRFALVKWELAQQD